MREFLNRCRQLEQKTERENQEASMNIFYKLNENIIKFFDEEKEKELDGIAEQGAIDFKILLFKVITLFFYTKRTTKKSKRNILD